MISFRQFAEHLERSAGLVDGLIADVVVVVTKSAETRARGYIGSYQSAVGEIGAWPQLSTATLEGFVHRSGRYIPGKEELGYAPPDNPLERSGETRDSITGEAVGPTGVIGSPLKKMLWQELGTPNAEYPIPPRPVLARAVMEAVPEIEALCGEVAVTLLVPKGERL